MSGPDETGLDTTELDTSELDTSELDTTELEAKELSSTELDSKAELEVKLSATELAGAGVSDSVTGELATTVGTEVAEVASPTEVRVPVATLKTVRPVT